jgi:hypothetical protein
MGITKMLLTWHYVCKKLLGSKEHLCCLTNALLPAIALELVCAEGLASASNSH